MSIFGTYALLPAILARLFGAITARARVPAPARVRTSSDHRGRAGRATVRVVVIDP